MIYKTISSPLNILLAFLLVVFLYLLRLSTQITAPSFETAIYLILCLICMSLGMAVGIGLILQKKDKVLTFSTHSAPLFKRKLIFLLLFSTLAFLFEHCVFYNKFGSLPIFNPRFEVLRMEFPVSGYIHILAMAGFIVALPLYYDLIIHNGSWSRKEKFFFYSLVFINIIMALLVGNRGTIALFFVQCFIIKFSFEKIRFRRFLFVIFCCAYVLGASKLFRDYMFAGPSVIDDIAKVWVLGGNVIFLPFYYCYVTFVMNFEILNQYIHFIDGNYLGYFSLVLPFDSLFNHDAYQLINLQQDVLHNDFYGLLTSTGFGVPYFDFGYFGGVVIFLLSFGLGLSYSVAYLLGKIYYIPFYAYFMTAFLTLIYTYSFNELYTWIYMFLLFFISRLYKRHIQC